METLWLSLYQKEFKEDIQINNPQYAIEMLFHYELQVASQYTTITLVQSTSSMRG